MVDADPRHTPELGAEDARQARWGRPVFVVLIVSTVLAAAALLAVWAWRSGDLARAEPRPPTPSAGQFNAPDTNRGPTSTASSATAPSPPRE